VIQFNENSGAVPAAVSSNFSLVLQARQSKNLENRIPTKFERNKNFSRDLKKFLHNPLPLCNNKGRRMKKGTSQKTCQN
jgi:hypothetical protein